MNLHLGATDRWLARGTALWKSHGPPVELVLLTLLAAVIYLPRLSALPVCGEESRWASAAIEMLESGDFIVPRQQGRVFPERPPLGSWAMALVGAARGQVDALAIRLPSVAAIAATAAVVFVYARSFLSGLGAFTAGAAFLSMAQVLEIGRMGESEALFTLFVSAALLLWHRAHMRGQAASAAWTLGYSLAALGALVKGVQAPVYFAAGTWLYLAARRDGRYFFCWGHALGLAAFAAIVGAWQIPFFWLAGWDHTVAIWFGLAGDRFTWAGLVEHMATYPVETFACLAPWSFMPLALWRRHLWTLLSRHAPWLGFVTLAIVAAYPSVWLAAGARGRYFMPLYPCFAVVVGAIVAACVEAPAGLRLLREWTRFLLTAGGAVLLVGWAALVLALTPTHQLGQLAPLQPSLAAAALFALAALAAGATLLRCCWTRDARWHLAGVALLAAFLGLCYSSAAIDAKLVRANDPAAALQALRRDLPPGARLVSFGPIHHRFVYFHQETIPELPWPESAEALPADVTYFCVDYNPGDTPRRRASGRGRVWGETPGTLPFAWAPVAVVSCERNRLVGDQQQVIVGRVIRPLLATRQPAQVDAAWR